MSKTTCPHDIRTADEVLRRHRDVLTNLARLGSMPSVTREGFFQEIANRVADAVEVDHVKLLRYRPERGDGLDLCGRGHRRGP
jgi:hypothetical protein